MNSRKKFIIISSFLCFCLSIVNIPALITTSDIISFANMSNSNQDTNYNTDKQNEPIEGEEDNIIEDSGNFAAENDLEEQAVEPPILQLSQLPKVNVIATGYTAGPESTGKTPDDEYYGITSTGVEVRRDFYSTIAADPTVFPYGTILYIPGYGFGVVADCGGAIKGNRLDLFFNTLTDVYEQWGKKEVDVFIIERGAGHVDEATMEVLNSRRTNTAMR